MRKTFDNKMILGTSAFALAFLATAGTDARAATASSSSSETYSTTSDLSGTVGFNPVPDAAFGLNSNITLGEFTVSKLAEGETKTFDGKTPFSIKYTPSGIGASKFGITDITFTGTLKGMVTGDTSDLTATFNADSSPVFHSLDGKYTSTIKVLNDPLGLVPSSTGGRTTIQARVTTVALDPSDPVPAGTGITTPEPTTFALLATSLVGLGLRHRLRSGRKLA